jgi:hypothetical protein
MRIFQSDQRKVLEAGDEVSEERDGDNGAAGSGRDGDEDPEQPHRNSMTKKIVARCRDKNMVRVVLFSEGKRLIFLKENYTSTGTLCPTLTLRFV